MAELTQSLTDNPCRARPLALSVDVGAVLAWWAGAATAAASDTGLPRWRNIATIAKITAAVLVLLAGQPAALALRETEPRTRTWYRGRHP